MAKEEFINAGYTVVGTEDNENKLLSFLKENYPNVIRDTEINIEELKAVLGLPCTSSKQSELFVIKNKRHFFLDSRIN